MAPSSSSDKREDDLDKPDRREVVLRTVPDTLRNGCISSRVELLPDGETSRLAFVDAVPYGPSTWYAAEELRNGEREGVAMLSSVAVGPGPKLGSAAAIAS
jgi:hypothetical protein